jgi:hypothetical protein
MTTATTETLLAQAGAAAEAAVALLPASGPLTVGTPSTSADAFTVTGTAGAATAGQLAREPDPPSATLVSDELALKGVRP